VFLCSSTLGRWPLSLHQGMRPRSAVSYLGWLRLTSVHLRGCGALLVHGASRPREVKGVRRVCSALTNPDPSTSARPAVCRGLARAPRWEPAKATHLGFPSLDAGVAAAGEGAVAGAARFGHPRAQGAQGQRDAAGAAFARRRSQRETERAGRATNHGPRSWAAATGHPVAASAYTEEGGGGELRHSFWTTRPRRCPPRRRRG
jgi:hypothetical protein